MPLLKTFQAPKASLTLNIAKDSYVLGESITGDLVLSSDEEFEAKEIRVELYGVERLRSGGEPIRGASETLETRIYSPRTTTVQKGTTAEYSMHNGQSKISERFIVPRGFSQQYSFKIVIPSNMGPTFQGMRTDGQWLERTWTLKGVVSIGGRPDVEARRVLNISLPSAIQQPAPPAPSPQIQPSFAPTMPAPMLVPQPQPKPAPTRQVISSCTRCGAPITPSQEDLIVTCRYCGYTISLSTQDEIKKPRNVVLSFSNYYVWPMLARNTMISEINFYDVPAAKKIPFDAGKIPSDAEFLNTEFNEEEARSRVKPEVESKERLIASGKVDTLQSCSTNVSIGDGELVHAPIWFVQYSLSGDNYVILIDGCEGKVLGGGRPLFKFS